MVQPLNQTIGYTQVGEQDPLAVAKGEGTAVSNPPLVPSAIQAEQTPVTAPTNSNEFAQQAAVSPVDSGNAPAGAASVSPTQYRVDFAANLGNTLSNILQTTEPDKSTKSDTSSGAPVNEPSIEARKADMQKQKTPETPVPGLEGYNSVLPDTQAEKPTAGKGNKFLNLVGRAEGTDKGRGYNETLGYGQFTGGSRDLTNMTLDQIDQLQSQMLRHPANKLNSSAVGRYQIVRTTLREFRDRLGLKGTDKYTPAVQDRLAMKILQVQGPNAWAGLSKVASSTIHEAIQAS